MRTSSSPLTKWAQSSPSLLALQTPEQEYTWAQLADKVYLVAASLEEQGLVPGQVLTCEGKNSVELLFMYLASLELGVTCAFTMPQTENELRQKLSTLYANQSDVKLWFTQEPSVTPLSQNIVYAEAQNQRELGCFHDDNLASIVFTSGSTGQPKAVAHTSSQHLASASGLLEKFKFNQGDTWLLSLPMYHVSGLAIVYRWLHSGATLKVGAGDLSHDIQGVTHASLVATQLRRLLDNKTPLSLTHVLLGGSHVPLSLSQQAATQGIETWLGYGMTEAASTVTAKQIDESYSAGRVLPNRKVQLRDQRIFIGGATLASGYFQQGEITPIVEDGWFDSKDLGEWIGDELKIIGRADNQFISGGENIHCEEIEAVLNQLNDVVQAMVVPIEDAEFGHRPVAVLQANRMPVRSIIEQHLQFKLAKFKWPVNYYLMPKSLLEEGIKVSRAKVKEWLLKQLDEK